MIGSPAASKTARRGGCALLEVLIHALVFSALLVCVGGRYGDELFGAEESRRLRRGHELLEQTVDAIAAYPFDDLAAIDGAEFGDRATTGESDFKVLVEVVATSSETLSVSAVLCDSRSLAKVSRCVTYRGRSQGD